ncbi:DUF58 domain-containing protein [archaeon]|nr:DUF58 domain-containing protein [archaeon]
MKIFKRQLKVDLTPKIRRLEALSKRVLKEQGFGGEYKTFYRGTGLEFDSYRPYISSYDDANEIDWKASHRAKDLLVKTYVEERDLDVFILVDVSQSMVFGSADKLKNEYTVELVASLVHAILEAGDNVGLSTFSDKPLHKVLPSRSRSQFYSITKMLLNPDIYGGKFDFNEAMKFIFNFVQKSNTLVILISDFVNLPKNWEEFLSVLGVKYDAIAIMVRDIRDKILPEDTGQVLVSDPDSNRQLLIDSNIVKKRYEDYVRKQEKEIENTFRKYQIDFVNLTTDKTFIQPILQYFARRGAKWV